MARKDHRKESEDQENGRGRSEMERRYSRKGERPEMGCEGKRVE